MRRWLAALAAVGLLAGCAGPVAPKVPGGSPATSGAAPAASDPTLIAQRKAAGLPDCEVPAGGATPLPVGLPDLELRCLGSDRAVNLAQLRGRPMVINVWAQWCGPCRQEAPAFAQLAKRAGDRVRVLGIDLDDPDPAAAIEFARASGWTYPHLVDATSQLKSKMAMAGIPITLFVDAEGRVVLRRTGGIESPDELLGLVKDYLGVTL